LELKRLIAKEGLSLILISVVISLIFFSVAFLTKLRLGLVLASLSAVVTLFLLYFFRDPERKIPQDPNLIVAPSDGRILTVESTPGNNFLNTAGKKVSVFLSPLDVHVIRSPIDGRVEFVNYQKGKFKAAYKDKASLENENLELGISAESRKIVLKQIAGFLARRIVCHAMESDRLARGARLGVIKFGSRVELILPENVELTISPKQRVKAGETIIGVLK
jgi:phosphatidylserine decarboxylase